MVCQVFCRLSTQEIPASHKIQLKDFILRTYLIFEIVKFKSPEQY